jgi:hypothetical protein
MIQKVVVVVQELVRVEGVKMLNKDVARNYNTSKVGNRNIKE